MNILMILAYMLTPKVCNKRKSIRTGAYIKA